MINDQIYTTSLYKAVEKAKKIGKLKNLKLLLVYDLYRYYINFAQSLSDAGSIQFEDTLVSLKKTIASLQYKYPEVFCDYEVLVPNDSGYPNPPGTIPNTAPTVSDNCVEIGSATSYKFKVGDFTVNYADAENHPWKYLLIYGDEQGNGAVYTKGGSPIVPNPPNILNIEGLDVTDDIPSISFTRLNPDAFGATYFNFRISDNPVDYLYSAMHTICITAASATTANLPPSDIGDRTIYVDNRVVTVFTLYDFTGGLQAPYNDPEGDLIDAIRVIDISNANQGVFKLNGVAITEGQIITREDINAGLFTHEAADTDAVQSDVFEFEARDEGSQIWVG